MCRRPPRSTLFPTRRSSDLRGAQQHMVGLMLAQYVVDEIGGEQHLASAFLLAGEAARDQAGDQRAVTKGALHQRGFGDRKSTRLNSSHLGISYAVFCLKKKT